MTGVLTQALRATPTSNWACIATSLFGMQLTDYALLAALVMLVHVLANHKYIGHLHRRLYFVLGTFMGQLGLEHNLYQFGSDARHTYSDMNRFGPFLRPFWWFKAYWGAWAVLFALFSNLLWVRGQETGAGRAAPTGAATYRTAAARRRRGSSLRSSSASAASSSTTPTFSTATARVTMPSARASTTRSSTNSTSTCRSRASWPCGSTSICFRPRATCMCVGDYALVNRTADAPIAAAFICGFRARPSP